MTTINYTQPRDEEYIVTDTVTGLEVDRRNTRRTAEEAAVNHTLLTGHECSIEQPTLRVEAINFKKQHGELLVRPDFTLADGQRGIEYVYPGTYELYKAEREPMGNGVMTEVINRRGTSKDHLDEAVNRAVAKGRILGWNIEPIPTGKDDWTPAQRDEWIGGQLVLIEDAKAVNPNVKQCIYRVPFFASHTETRIIWARDAAAGGTMAADAGFNPLYWADPERLPKEQATYSLSMENKAYFTPIMKALDYECVHGYQREGYHAKYWFAAEMARASISGKPIVVWLSPKYRGYSDTDWVGLDELVYIASIIEMHDASVIWWINGTDMQNTSSEMAERFNLLRATI